jgi:hypothetical protein
MVQKIKLDDREYDIDVFSAAAKAQLTSLQFATQRMQELKNMQALLQRAKNSYIDSIKQEMISDKAGFLFSSD